MVKTSIEWCDYTINPGIYGCSPASKGCANCWAAKMAHRQVAMGNYPEGITHKTANGVKWTSKVIVDQSAITREFAKLPKRVHKKVFVTSMSDLFHEKVPDDFICDVFYMMAQMKHHTFMVLTKRARRMLDWFNRSAAQGSKWHKPLPNVIGMVTAETQEQADKRVPLLLECPFSTYGISVEPMLSGIDLHLDQSPPCSHRGCYQHATHPCEECGRIQGRLPISLVICGGETGSNSRPMYPVWPQLLRNQCENAGIDFLFKAWGDYDPHPAKCKQWINCGWSKNNKRHGSTLL